MHDGLGKRCNFLEPAVETLLKVHLTEEAMKAHMEPKGARWTAAVRVVACGWCSVAALRGRRREQVGARHVRRPG